MYMRFRFVPNIVVSSPKAAEQFLKTHDLVFASRPPHKASKYISYEQRNMSFKLCTLDLLSNLKITSFQSMRKEELSLLVKFIEQAAQNRVLVDLSAKFDERGFKAEIQEGIQLAAKPNIGDYFPYVGALDLQGLNRKMKALSKVFDEFFEKIIDEHALKKQSCSKDRGQQTKDFVDIMLAYMDSQQSKFQIDRNHVKSLILDMLAASMDTSSTAIEWVLSELPKHPQVMKKVQNELEKIVGLDRMVEESDLDDLDYLNMVVKEAFRLHPVAPLLLPTNPPRTAPSTATTYPERHVSPSMRGQFKETRMRGPNPRNFYRRGLKGVAIDLRGRDFFV
ncbi:hypothetical protein ACSBR2_009156 [Camellia fascicularis]